MAEKCNINLGEIRERVETIVVTNSFMEETTDQLIEDITKELKNISDEYALSNITEVVDTIYSTLLDQGAVDRNPTFFNITNIRNILEGNKLGVLPNTQSQARAEHASFQETEQMQLRQNVTSEFLDNAYGMVTEAKKQAMDTANQNIFDALFINRGLIKIEGQDAGIVASNLEMNRNIRIYQQQLLNKIVEYLNSIIKPSMSISEEAKDALANPILYKDGEITQVLTHLRPLITSYLSRSRFMSSSDITGTSLDGLRSLYKRANNSSDPTYKSARLELDAYNANVILQNFDSYLDVILGDIIEIQDFGKKTGRDNKYAIGKKTAKLLTTWTTSEDRDVESEADFITKLAINTTPLYNWQGSIPISGKFLTFADYQYIIGKIKDLAWNESAINHVMVKPARYGNRLDTPIYWNSLSEKTQKIIKSIARNSDGTLREVRFSSLINMIRRNPRKYLSAIFELLSNQNFIDAVGFNSKIFSDGDKKVIYSLSKGVFSPLEGNSLYNLSKLDAETDYYSFITQVADTIFNVGYVQYYRNEEGVLQARTFISQNINNLRRNIETVINTANSTRTIKDISIYEKKLQLEENSKNQITFTIPNTNITATVHTSGSAVIFTDKNGQVITDFKDLLQDSNILQFLDSKLRLNINDDIDLQNALVESFEGKSKLMQDLLSFASRIVLNQHIISKYIDPIQDIIEKEVKLKELFGNNAPKYDKQLEIVNSISGVDINTLRTIAIAKANAAGITTATQTKDGAGNGQSMQTQSRLLGSQWSQFELQEKQAWSATKDCLILNVPGLYEGAFTAKEYYDGMESKSFVDMCVSEFSYASFVNDYIGGLAISLTENPNSLVGDGHVMFLPSVISDKGTIGRIKINLNKAIPTKDGTVKPIKEFNHEELRWLIAKQFGTVYTRMYEAVQNDWNTLHQFATKQLTIPTFDYLSNFEAFNQWWVRNSHIEVIKGKEVRIGNTFGEKSPADFIKTLTLQYNQSHRLNPLTFIDQTHFQSKEQDINVDGELIKVKGSLASNQVLISQIARYNPTYLNDKGIDSSLYPDEQTFWKTKHKEVLKSLLKSRFEINTTGDKQKQKELEYLRKNYPTWINASGNVILAKVNWNGRIIDITSARDLIRFRQYKDENGHISDREVSDAILIDELPNIQLHPAIETWNYLDYLFTQEFMDCTVGSFINHPEKSKGKSREKIIREAEFKAANGFTEGADPRPALYERVLEQEAAHFQAQHKRNVSFTASMHEFQLNLLNSIPEVYNLAVIDDIHDEQGTIMGLLNDIKPFDGATFVNPFVVLLENFALGGASAGISKKQFVHFKNERTGGGGIIKTAGFGLTNDWIRNSPFLQRMMQKMTDHVWLNEDGSPAIVNITKDYKGNQITLKNRYFEQNGRVFEIIRIESLGNNQYRRVIQEVEIDQYKRPLVNSHIGPEITESPKIINTNYLLWKFLGGDRSMSIDNSGNYLEYSNSSVENVVKIMNRCAGEDTNGNIITKNNIPIDEIETQDDLWQPLKQVDVHYLATAGAVKQGAANINSNSKYHDDVAYDTQRIKMYQAGIQLDKEHHADDAELSLMTQVISACAAKGYTFEAATRLYDALRKSTEIGIKEHLNAVKEFITSNDITGVQEAMYEAIIHSLGTSKTNQNNFAYLVASDLIRQAREGKKIKFSEASLPLSDKTIYSKIFSTVASYLTNAGIKQKIPGILSVLTPSHNIFKLYAGRKYESFTNPEQELEEVQAQQVPIYDTTDPNSISNLELGRSYRITRLVPSEFNEQGEPLYNPTEPNIETKVELIRTPSEYYKLKQEIAQGNVIQVVEDVTVGRDLAAYNVRFSISDGSRFQLWDLDSITALFEYNEILDSDLDAMSKDEALLAVAEKALGRTFYWSDLPNIETFLRRALQRDLMNLSKSTPALNRQYKQLLDSNDGTQAWFNRFAQWVNIHLGTGNGSKLVLPGFNSLTPKEDLVYINPGETTQEIAAQIGGIDTLRHPDANGMHFGNPFSHANYKGAIKVGSVKRAVQAYEKWLRRDTALDQWLTQKLSPEEKQQLDVRREWILNQINSGALDNKPLVYYRTTVPDDSYGRDIYGNALYSYDKSPNHAHILQKLILEHNPALGIPTENKIRVTADNFNTVEPLVRQAIINSTKVRIGGDLKTVDKSSINIQAYELIMPKTFATNFGLKQFDSLSEIENNPNWFVEQYRQNSEVQVESNSYSIALKTSTGNHTYLLSKAQLDTIDTQKYHKVDRDNIGLMSVDGKTVRLDSKGNILYEVSDDFELYIDDKGNEIIVTNDLTFYINNTSFESIQISQNLLERPQVFRNILDSINKSKNKIAKSFYRYITFGKESNLTNIFNNSVEYNRIPNENEVGYQTNPLIRALREKHTSFVKALDVVAARIPSQSMQSFMPMRVVAFDNPDINTAYVSTMQILLQGSKI